MDLAWFSPPDPLAAHLSLPKPGTCGLVINQGARFLGTKLCFHAACNLLHILYRGLHFQLSLGLWRRQFLGGGKKEKKT